MDYAKSIKVDSGLTSDCALLQTAFFGDFWVLPNGLCLGYQSSVNCFYFIFCSCMKHLGEHHPFFVSSLVPQLFITHPYYAVPEPNIDDPAHIAVAALVFNATLHCPSILSLLPPFAQQHYCYLKESLPKLIPALANTPSSSCQIQAKSKFGNQIHRTSKIYPLENYSPIK